MSQSRKIIHQGNPILSQKSLPVENIQSPQIQELISELIDTTLAANGVGIAAPQIAESLRLFIVASRPNPRYPDAPLMEPTAMINPHIIEHSQEVVKGWEGCLSVPNIRGLVPRYQWINIEYTDINGEIQQCQITDFIARIFQHEYDHLEGILFVDRIESDDDLFSEAEYQKLIS
ncbi:peptide deformylase [Calothrix sp. PCC 6303]|uniref:peptide deformylase n=1 Tax=Calothrix sp. PCC 6303 TaxID=1170562 RepID=UPI0002A01661|nr:peptide deformylase [Calothrix sp. PCC 6303]AFZ04127.1 Peptide deformylase [Calothrix sp. PCC 6303]